jgi:Zn ribbon nucleic-acid-binding protein
MRRALGMAEATGTFLERVTGAMFGFTPPATPQTAPLPCPQCHSLLAIAMYATQRTEYFRCVQCRHVWTLTHEEPVAEAHEPDTDPVPAG